MRIAVISLFPEMFSALTDYGVTGRAVKDGRVEMSCFNPRDFAADKHRTVDDRPYGGGPGMVMLIQPLRDAINAAREWLEERESKDSKGLRAKVVYLSPQGQKLDQAKAAALSASQKPLILLCGRYEGIDERLIELEVDAEISVGDYVLSGGELPAMVLMDAVIRQLPGVLGHEDSAQQDSFSEGLLDYPQYTRPEVYEDLQVPEVLMSGDHKKIAEWRKKVSVERTKHRRPDLMDD